MSNQRVLESHQHLDAREFSSVCEVVEAFAAWARDTAKLCRADVRRLRRDLANEIERAMKGTGVPLSKVKVGAESLRVGHARFYVFVDGGDVPTVH